MERELSLIDFVDRANQALFFEGKLPAELRLDLAAVAALQGKPGSYAGMFTLPECDESREFRTFTGEPAKSNAARRHIIGEETIRILSLAGKTNPEVIPACRRAVANMTERIHQTDEVLGTLTGIYCCGLCSCSFWRNLAAGDFDHPRQRLKHGLRELKNCRLGNGRWRRFPFYYTLLALSELDAGLAEEEIAYALPAIRKSLKSPETTSMYIARRRELLTRILAARNEK